MDWTNTTCLQNLRETVPVTVLHWLMPIYTTFTSSKQKTRECWTIIFKKGKIWLSYKYRKRTCGEAATFWCPQWFHWRPSINLKHLTKHCWRARSQVQLPLPTGGNEHSNLSGTEWWNHSLPLDKLWLSFVGCLKDNRSLLLVIIFCSASVFFQAVRFLWPRMLSGDNVQTLNPKGAMLVKHSELSEGQEPTS